VHGSIQDCSDLTQTLGVGADDLVAAGEQFDVVCSLEVIEHVADVEAFLKSLTPQVNVRAPNIITKL
jgi:2-polyprenyl-3-methyl-5-hydroxy-6-metoxy-1,4-benzoquinol methylase